ncbi:NAD-dependent epimerase/dehydratase family protein [Shimia thalassica]|uniref:NAD-dependent epimerase/dehydratase family protein n=1 Tax=Shimia thalassica TaxID=1715693 RepID=UPI0024947EFD|nr:NAD(P)H-binding protein [Shimia thalassica]
MGAVGEKRTLLVTGAAGYIGQATVRHALRDGHTVKAVLRPGRPVPDALAGAEIVFADLVTDNDTLAKALRNVDVVIHAAGSFSSDADTLMRDTIQASSGLLDAMSQAAVSRVVLVSSIAIYGYQGATKTDESAELETHFDQRDAYCRAKTEQENLFRTHASLDLTVLRVGAVWGPNRLFNAHLGVSTGPLFLRIGNATDIPTCHIETCASALVSASCQASTPTCNVINILDDDRPDARRYLKAVQKCGWPKRVLPVPLFPLLTLAKALPASLQRVGLLKPATLAARFGAVQYSNKRLHMCLEDVTMVTFEDAMTDAIKNTDGSKA